VRVAWAAARPLAAALLALEAGGGVMGLALARLQEPPRENMEQVLNAEERAILASNAGDMHAKWAEVLRKAAGAFKIPGDAGVLCVRFPVGSIGKYVTMKITVNVRCMAHALRSREDEQYDKPVPFEQVLIDKEKKCK
jgi:hypothetical protein